VGESHSLASFGEALTPSGTVVSLGTPTPDASPAAQHLGQLVSSHGEVSLEVLLALRRLQEQNEALQQENERLRAVHYDDDDLESAPTADEALLVEAPAELAPADGGM